MKNYVNVSKNISIEDHFPLIGSKIKVMTKQTKKDINHFDNITYDNNEYIIRLVRKSKSKTNNENDSTMNRMTSMGGKSLSKLKYGGELLKTNNYFSKSSSLVN